MRKILGILGLLVAISVITALLTDGFLNAYNVENVLRRSALFGIISIGAALVIMTGGIDLSIGSVVGLVGCLLPWLLVEHGWPPAVALPALLLLSLVIGAFHGLLVTRLRLQPFVVTLCGLLLYRGITRGLLSDQTPSFSGRFGGLRELATGRIPIAGGFALPEPVVILVVIAVLAAVLLNHTVWGRYLLAIGRNETAARYSGVNTDRMVLLAYALCGLLAGAGGLLFAMDIGSMQPSEFGNFYELYAIAGAVLGGCSLRGGEGTILGVILGAAVMQVLRNSIVLIEQIPDNVEFAVIGAVILCGVIVDELVKRAVRR